jgi:hypothetical protein
MFNWLFGKNYEVEIADLNRVITSLQKQVNNMEKLLNDIDVPSEVETAISNADIDSLAENALEEAMNRATIRFRY